MGLLDSIKGLFIGAEDDLNTAREIYANAKDRGRDLTAAEIKAIDKLMDMREDKLERTRDSKWTGLG